MQRGSRFGEHLAAGTEVKVVTGIDDHSRFIVSAKVVAAATDPVNLNEAPLSGFY